MKTTQGKHRSAAEKNSLDRNAAKHLRVPRMRKMDIIPWWNVDCRTRRANIATSAISPSSTAAATIRTPMKRS